MKVIVKILIGAALLGLLVFMTFFSKTDLGDKIRLRWVVDPSPSRQIEIKGFEEIYPNIKIEMMSGIAGTNSVLTQIAGDFPPDVFAIYAPSTLRIFMEKNALLDLKPYLKKYNVDEKDFWPALSPYMYHKDKVFGLPPNCGPFVLFYNKDMFDKKGIEYPNEKWTWKEFLYAAKKLTDININNKEYKQFGLLTEDPMLFIWQNGGRMFSKDGRKCIINSEAAKEGLRFYYDLRFKDHVMPRPQEMQNLAASGGWGGTLNLFAARKVAMFIQGRWMSMVFRKDNRLNWDIAPVPRGKEKVTMLASKVYAIPKNSKNIENAVKFLMYQISKKNQLLIAKMGDGIPSRKSIGVSDEFLYDPEFPNEKHNKIYLDEMKYAKSPEYTPFADSTQVDRIWYEELEKMYSELQGPDEMLDAVAKRINKIIRK